MNNRTEFGLNTAAIALTAGVLLLAAGTARAATRIWTGLGADNLASTAENWSDNTQPDSGSDIVLNATTNKNMTWDAGINNLSDTVASWTQTEDYTGTVTFQTVYGATGFTNFTITGDCVVSNGVWTHLGNTDTEANRLRVTVGGNLILGNATMTADTLGYAALKGPGAGANASGWGGAYGGAGGGPNASLANAQTYGSVFAPVNLGSGGFKGKGGGAILLTVSGTTTMSSTLISANGQGTADGCGSGGSILLTTGWLTGSGIIRANCNPGQYNGPGSGGRVAIVLTGEGADFSSWTGTNTAYGVVNTSGGAQSAAGTVYLKTADGVDSLIVDNNNIATYGQRSTLMPDGMDLNSLSNVIIRNKGILGISGDTTVDFSTFTPTVYGPANSFIAIDNDAGVTYPDDWTIDNYTLYANAITPNKPVNVTIGSNGVLSHYGNAIEETYKLDLTIAGDLTVLSGGTISGDSLGYARQRGPGAGESTYWGGAYGGEAQGPSPAINTNTYGSVIAPTNLGSGGGTSGGGGALLLTVAGTTTVASGGTISANGQYGYDAAGSGGSVYLRTGWLTGSGTIQANGDTTYWNAQCGGGGRVAIVLTGDGADFSSWTGANTAYGGSPKQVAAAGTVYRQAAGIADGAGTVIVDNNVAAPPLTSVPAAKNLEEDLRSSHWLVAGHGKLGATADAQIGYLTVSGANARVDLRGRKLSVLPDLDLNGTLYGVGTYTTNQLAGGLVVDSVGGGVLEVRPMVDNADGATDVTTTGATLNGNIFAAEPSSALFALWGPEDAGADVAQWAYTNTWPAPVSAGAYSVPVSAPDLLPNTVHYYRFYTTNSTRTMIASESSVFMTSAVTVEKTADAHEAGLIPGAFTFSRHADATNGALTVTYGIGGTAQPGVHYVDNLGTSITFTEGAAQAELVVTPLQDDVSQEDETVVLTLEPGPFLRGSPSVATGVIFNVSYPDAPTNTWIGSGNASDGANWSLGHAPTTGEDVLLSGFSTSNLVWDIDGGVASWIQTEQYTGTVTFQTVYGESGFTNFTIAGDCVVSNGVWTHLGNTDTEANRLRVTVGGNLILSSVTMTADMLGFAALKGPGAGANASGWGGAYGGAAGGPNASLANAQTYGSVFAPVNLGSGGFKGKGGGAILLTVSGTTTMSSALISANGQGTADGCGSGGSIFLTTGWLTGSGIIRANCNPGQYNGPGSGGRVAIILTGEGADFSSWTGTNTAYGTVNTSGGAQSAAGTVYLKRADGVDSLIVDNNNIATYGQRSTLMPGGMDLNSLSNVIIRNKGILGISGDTTVDFNTFTPTVYGPADSFIAIDNDAGVTYPDDWTIDNYTLYANAITPNKPVNVTIGSNGVLSHYGNAIEETYKLDLTITGNLTVLSGGKISADSLGYAQRRGPGAGESTYWGGAYGGEAQGPSPAINTNTYGSVIAPTNLGSGGGTSGGGGALLLTVAGTTTVASGGTLSANGQYGNDAAGSGGSIYLRTGWLTGSGTIQANGNTTFWNAQCGGGGRVAIVLTGDGADFSSWAGANTAYGGSPKQVAAAGTVYRQAAGERAGAGTVIVDNGSIATNATFTSLPAFKNMSENLALSSWSTANNARIGLTTNTTITGLTLNTNGSLELAGQTLTTKTLTVEDTVFRPGTYTPADTPLITDAVGGGRVIVTGLNIGSLFFLR